MKIDILTLFPEMFESVMNASIMGRARENGLLAVETHDIRAYTENKHNKADDYPFGGGAGLVMMAQPIFDCMDDVGRRACKTDPAFAARAAAHDGACARACKGKTARVALRAL